jgi:hypothetical protein
VGPIACVIATGEREHQLDAVVRKGEMSRELLAVLVVVPIVMVVVALFMIMWRERSSLRESSFALVRSRARRVGRGHQDL